MELPIALQALQFAISGLIGLSLGVVYDCLRVIRHHRRSLTIALDALFLALFLLTLLLMCYYVGGGIFRFFMLGGVFLGISLWFSAGSGWFVPLLDCLFCLFWRAISALFRPIHTFFENGKIFLKKGFSFVERTGIIDSVLHPKFRRRLLGRRGECIDAQEIATDCKIDYLDRGRILYRYPTISAGSDYGEKGRKRVALGKAHNHRAGK
ncbi:MAG: spore cortex biosynthesis protein YabQ [Oscillospiraceae bacterium]|nr:spore cortex biosynthesis protein YabQ [Oscillospiraceae bacterium]